MPSSTVPSIFFFVISQILCIISGSQQFSTRNSLKYSWDIKSLIYLFIYCHRARHCRRFGINYAHNLWKLNERWTLGRHRRKFNWYIFVINSWSHLFSFQNIFEKFRRFWSERLKFCVKIESGNLMINEFLENVIYLGRILTTNAADPIYWLVWLLFKRILLT